MIINPFILAAPGGGGGSITDPTDLYQGNVTEGYWPSDIAEANIFTTSAKSVAVTTNGDQVGAIESITSGPDMTWTSGRYGAYNATDKLITHDANADRGNIAVTTRGTDMLLAFVLNTTDAAWSLVAATDGSAQLRADEGSGTAANFNVGTPTIYKDGVELTLGTSDDLFNDLSDGTTCVVIVDHLDLDRSGFDTIRVCDGCVGDHGYYVLVESPGNTDDIAALNAFLAAK